MKLVLLIVSVILYASISSAQSFEWVKKAGDNGNYYNYGSSVAIDHHHNIIVVGTYSNYCIFPITTLFTPGAWNAYIAKYDAIGNLLWLKTIGGDSTDAASAVAIDANDNIYVTGNMHSPVIHFTASDSLTNGNIYGWNGFLAKYDATGNFQWSESVTSLYNNKALSLTVDPNNNPVIGGYFTTYSNFSNDGSHLLTTLLRGGSTNIFLAKYSSTGNLQWIKQGESNNNCLIAALASDNAGNIYATGKLSGSTAFGTKPLGTIIDQSLATFSFPTNFYDYVYTATLNFTGSCLQVSGGNNDFYNFLYYYYFSNLENFKVESNLKVTTGGTGVGLGKYANNYVLADFPLSDTGVNKIKLYMPAGTIGFSPQYKIAVGDSVNISLQRSYDTISATLTNFTRKYVVTTGYRYLIGPPVTNTIMPNNGYYAMYFLGGVQNIYNFKLSSTENATPLTAFAGNSITTGYYSGGKGSRYADLTYKNSPYLYVTNAGAGDRTIHVLYDTTEIINLNPKYVFMNIGANDVNAGLDTNVYQGQLVQLVTTYKNHGITPVMGTLTPLGGTKVLPYNRRIMSVASTYSLTLVDLYTSVVDTNGYLKPIYNSGDNVHPSPAGNARYGQTIIAQAPFLVSDTISWDATHQVIKTPEGNDRVFVSKFDSTGNLLWLQLDNTSSSTASSPSNTYSCGNSIGLDNASNIYVAGNYLNALYTTSSGQVAIQDAFIEKYNNSGTKLWQNRFGNNINDAALGIAINNTSDAYIIGNYSGHIKIGTDSLSPADYINLFIAKFNSSGTNIWATNTLGHANYGNAIAIDLIDTSLIITGSFNDSAYFGNIKLASAAPPSYFDYDIFTGKLFDRPRLGINELSNLNRVTVYPNPATTEIIIQFNDHSNYEINLTNMFGQTLQNASTNELQFNMDMSMLKPGIYFLSIKDEQKNTSVRKIIKM